MGCPELPKVTLRPSTCGRITETMSSLLKGPPDRSRSRSRSLPNLITRFIGLAVFDAGAGPRFVRTTGEMGSGSLELEENGHRVVGRFVNPDTHSDDLIGMPATEPQVELRSIDISQVEDRLLVNNWDGLNPIKVFQQFGALPQFDRAGQARS